MFFRIQCSRFRIGRRHFLQDYLVALQRRVRVLRHVCVNQDQAMLEHVSIFHTRIFAYDLMVSSFRVLK